MVGAGVKKPQSQRGFAPKFPSNRKNQRGAHGHLREDSGKTGENAVVLAEAWLGRAHLNDETLYGKF
jgi:hypothetical protein